MQYDIDNWFVYCKTDVSIHVLEAKLKNHDSFKVCNHFTKP